jgi:hypothetical protein
MSDQQREDESQRSDDEPRPLELRPSDQPWKPRHGPITRMVAWLILVGMIAGLIAMVLIAITGP